MSNYDDNLFKIDIDCYNITQKIKIRRNKKKKVN